MAHSLVIAPFKRYVVWIGGLDMFARVSRGAAVVGIAAGLSLGQVAMAGPVQAETNAGLLRVLAKASTRIGGIPWAAGTVGVVAAAPEVTAVAASSCVATLGTTCAALAVTAVAIGLYATQDTWIPWVVNAFGGEGSTSADGGCNQEGCGYTWDPLIVSGADIQVTLRATTGGWFITENLNYECRNENGTIEYHDVVHGTAYYIQQGLPAGGSMTFSRSCSAGQTVIRAWTTGGSYSTFNQVSWGPGFPGNEAATQARVSCVNPDGSQYEVIGQVTAPGPLPGDGLMVSMPTCDGAAGSQPGAAGKCVTLRAQPPGGVMSDQSTTCPGVSAETAAAYPNCVGGGRYCSYVIRLDGIACTVGATCAEWARIQSEDPSRVSCRYGPYVVDIAKCGFMERAYEPTGAPATGPNTDGNPRTWGSPGPQGQPEQATDPNPAPNPPPVAPLPPTQAEPSGTQQNQECWPSGAGIFNPASWVLQPIKCALSWAFVPSPAFLAQWGSGMTAGWHLSPPGAWINSIGALTPIIPGGGCAGPAVSTGFLGQGGTKLGPVMPSTIHPFDACSGVMATAAATSYLVLSAGIAFYGGMKVVRQLGYAFGFQVHVGSERSTFT